MSKKYFTESTEQAIHDYLNSTGQTRQYIYHTKLHPAFVIMTESIINRYFFGVDGEDEFDEIKYGAIGHLLKKLDKFNPSRAKAFSYCQTLIKNYCNDYFKNRTKRLDRYMPVDHEQLVRHYDQPVDEAHDQMLSVFDFIDFVTTGTSSLSPAFIHELKVIKRKCFNADEPEYDVTKITAFYKRIFTDRTTGWREVGMLREEFKEYLNRNNLN